YPRPTRVCGRTGPGQDKERVFQGATYRSTGKKVMPATFRERHAPGIRSIAHIRDQDVVDSKPQSNGQIHPNLLPSDSVQFPRPARVESVGTSTHWALAKRCSCSTRVLQQGS